MKISDFCVKSKADVEGEQLPRRLITAFAREQLWDYHLEPLLEEYLGAEVESKKEDLKKLREDFISNA